MSLPNGGAWLFKDNNKAWGAFNAADSELLTDRRGYYMPEFRTDEHEAPKPSERWTCSKCDERNKPERSLCNNCNAARPPLPEVDDCVYKIDFATMSQTNMTTKKSRGLRRLCGPITYSFKKKGEDWRPCDPLDSKMLEDLFTKNPGRVWTTQDFTFNKDFQTKYTVDFNEMKQTNTESNTIQELRRECGTWEVDVSDQEDPNKQWIPCERLDNEMLEEQYVRRVLCQGIFTTEDFSFQQGYNAEYKVDFVNMTRTNTKRPTEPRDLKHCSHSLQLLDAMGAPTPPLPEWFTKTFSGDWNSMTMAEISETLMPLVELHRDDQFGRIIFKMIDEKLQNAPKDCSCFGNNPSTGQPWQANLDWEISSVHRIHNDQALTDFDKIESNDECDLYFRGIQLQKLRDIVKNGFVVPGKNTNYWFGNALYFTRCLPYAQHYIGKELVSNQLRGKDSLSGFRLPKVDNVVYVLGCYLKPGTLKVVPKDVDKGAAGGYDGVYRNMDKQDIDLYHSKKGEPNYDSHVAYVSPNNSGYMGFRPVERNDSKLEEFVIFDSRRVLPSFVIGLRRTR